MLSCCYTAEFSWMENWKNIEKKDHNMRDFRLI